jgi:hypothetical protein
LTIIERRLGLFKTRQSFEDWLEMFIKNQDNTSNLYEFFKDHFLRLSGGSIILETQGSRAISRTLSTVNGVNSGAVEQYIDYWEQVGFL